jgi:2-polyprenyl-3-methyl-5-hydroxy-6-metoxy-1,4-benzoquinol methylase
MNQPNDYRQRIFDQYSSVVQNAPDMYAVRTVTRWGDAYRYYLRGWLPEDKNAAIAEIACGTGRLLHLLNRMGYSDITGNDISPQQVSAARLLVPKAKIEEGDAVNWLNENPGKFDLIIGMDIIEHLYKKDTLSFLDACYRALKPGGRLVLQTPNAGSLWGLHDRYNDFTHEVAFGYLALSQLFTLTGFQNNQGREVGPIPWGHGIKSTLRNLVWQFIRLGLLIWNLAETGSAGSRIFTRVFLISGKKS